MRNEREQDGGSPVGDLRRVLGLTAASALVWGVAHLRTGRRASGALLAGAFGVLVLVGLVAATGFHDDLVRLAVQPVWLNALTVGFLVLAVIWVSVVLRSYTLTRPERLNAGPRAAAASLVTVLCVAIITPFAYAAHTSYVARDAVTSIFSSKKHSKGMSADNPFRNKPRLNVLLLGGDAGSNRIGVRTDSVTLASIDTKTGDTVLLGLPRNLQQIQMPPGPAADRFPYGFTGDGYGTPGLLNEVWQYAEEHPELLPGTPKGERGPALLLPTVAGILGQPVDYYILVDMRGFAQVVNAMGGVWMRVPEDITFGRYNEGRVRAGYRKLNGTEALWYGRSRTFSDDYVRMGRQKCLLRAIARQADPQKVLTRFQKLAQAAKNTISTDIPADLLPALTTLSAKVKSNSKITSLQFVPPLISTGSPDYALIRHRAAQAIAESSAPAHVSAASAGTGGPKKTPKPTPTRNPAKALSLDETCPS